MNFVVPVLLATLLCVASAVQEWTVSGVNAVSGLDMDGCYTLIELSGDTSSEDDLVAFYTRDGDPSFGPGPVIQIRTVVEEENYYASGGDYTKEWAFITMMDVNVCGQTWEASGGVLVFTDDLGSPDEDDVTELDVTLLSENWYIFDGADTYDRITNDIALRRGCYDDEGSTEYSWTDDAVSSYDISAFNGVVPGMSLDVEFDDTVTGCETSDSSGAKLSFNSLGIGAIVVAVSTFCHILLS